MKLQFWGEILTKKQSMGPFAKMFNKPLYRCYFIIIVTIVLFVIIFYFIRPEIETITDIEILMVFVGVLAFEFTMIIIEFFLHFKNKFIKFRKKLRINKKPKFLEFGFLFFLFFATLIATQDIWWFSVFYGIALACGIYHYILRVDD